MNFEKYRNDGWGISIEGFKALYEIMKESKHEKFTILEFGSGTSTQFFLDFHNLEGIEIFVESYDNDEEYSSKIVNNKIEVKIRRLFECEDEHYEKMMKDQKFYPELVKLKTTPPSSRQKNCFYNFLEGDLKEIYDIVIIDGPHGNGRSLSNLFLKDKVKQGTIFFIDDYDHYPFLEIANTFFDFKILQQHKKGKDRFVILQIK